MSILSVTGTVAVESSEMAAAIDGFVEATSRDVTMKAMSHNCTIREYYPPVITVTPLPTYTDGWFTITVTTSIRI